VARSIQSAKGGGAPLHDGVRSSMEWGFGGDFSGDQNILNAWERKAFLGDNVLINSAPLHLCIENSTIIIDHYRNSRFSLYNPPRLCYTCPYPPSIA